MRRFRLKKDLPTFKAGQRFYINECGDLVLDVCHHKNDKQTEYGITAYCASTLQKFPNILTDWFEKVEPKAELSGQYRGKGGCTPVTFLSRSECADFGLRFQTLDEYEEWEEKQKAYQILRRDAKGFEPNWDDPVQGKYMVYYNHKKHDFFILCFHQRHSSGLVFATGDAARASIKAHEEEWKIYLGVEE